MQLHYNILWIDNDLPEYEEREAITGLNDFLLNLGFEPYIVTLYDQSELDKHLLETKFDLIISDYRLDNTTGDKIIEQIRSKEIMTEILFYSGADFRKDPEVQKRLFSIDRISFQHGREGLVNKIEGLINLTLDKLLDLNATRGIITAATSELDVTIESITNYLLQSKLNKSDDDLASIIEEYITDFLDKSPQSFKLKFKEIGFTNVFSFVDANRKWQIFRKTLKEYKTVDDSSVITDFLTNNKTYFNEVIDIRNKFAHAKAEEKEGKTVLKGQYGKEDFEFDNESCIDIRKNIIQHRKNFELLTEHLGI